MKLSKIIKDDAYSLQIRVISEQLSLGIAGKPHRLVLASGIQKNHGVSSLVENLAISLIANPDCEVLMITCCESDTSNGFFPLTENTSVSEITQYPVLRNMYAVKCLDSSTLNRWSILQKNLPEMIKKFTHVLIDGPPISTEPEMLRIVPDVDYMLLVVKAHAVKWQILNKTKQIIEQVGQKNIGVVLNRRKFFIPEKLYKLI